MADYTVLIHYIIQNYLMQVKIWVSNFKLQEILRINKDISLRAPLKTYEKRYNRLKIS